MLDETTQLAERIASLEIVDPYSIPRLEGMKDSYLDVRAVLDVDSDLPGAFDRVDKEALEALAGDLSRVYGGGAGPL